MLDRLGASMKKHQEKLLSWKGDTKASDRIPAKMSLVKPQPKWMKDKPRTLIQPKMGV